MRLYLQLTNKCPTISSPSPHRTHVVGAAILYLRILSKVSNLLHLACQIQIENLETLKTQTPTAKGSIGVAGQVKLYIFLTVGLKEVVISKSKCTLYHTSHKHQWKFCSSYVIPQWRLLLPKFNIIQCLASYIYLSSNYTRLNQNLTIVE